MDEPTPQRLRHLIREMPGERRCDLTRLLRDHAAFQGLIRSLSRPFRDSEVTRVAAIDAIGFALGGAVAYELGAGLILVRKPAKLAWETEVVDFVDYTGERGRLELAADAVQPGDRVLIVDDWSETGAQLKATIRLVERLGGSVVGASLLNIDARVRSDEQLSGYQLNAVIAY